MRSILGHLGLSYSPTRGLLLGQPFDSRYKAVFLLEYRPGRDTKFSRRLSQSRFFCGTAEA